MTKKTAEFNEEKVINPVTIYQLFGSLFDIFLGNLRIGKSPNFQINFIYCYRNSRSKCVPDSAHLSMCLYVCKCVRQSVSIGGAFIGGHKSKSWLQIQLNRFQFR